MPWVREGECNRCGECCKSGDPFNGELGEPEIKNSCPLLTIKEGVFTCKDRQHPYYLGGCVIWPTEPRQIENYPSCSYTFKWVD